MQEVNHQIIATIITAIVLLLAIAIIMLLLAVYYTNTKKRLIKEKDLLKANYNHAILQAQLEMHEQTLHNVSQEIHDNIGQVLSFVKLNLATAVGLTDELKDEKIAESRELVAEAITNLRDLSKSLNSDSFSTKGFILAIQTEAARINKSGLVVVDFTLGGGYYTLGEQRELVLFRILQESVNNALKHANAKYLNIGLQYSENLFTLTVTDDGVGFDPNQAAAGDGSGLKNIRNRANLIGAHVNISSAAGEGSVIKLTINPLELQSYAYRKYTSSPG